MPRRLINQDPVASKDKLVPVSHNHVHIQSVLVILRRGRKPGALCRRVA